LSSLNKGFKPSICKDKHCIGCVTKPPLISAAVVRKLGSTFYQIDPKHLSDEKLLSKPAAKRLVGRPKKSKSQVKPDPQIKEGQDLSTEQVSKRSKTSPAKPTTKDKSSDEDDVLVPSRPNKGV
jgi:hypothetical protein